MMPGTVDLTVQRSTDNGLVRITCKDAEGAVVDLTEFDGAYATVSRSFGGALLVDLEPSISDAVNGIVEVALDLSAGALASLQPERYRWMFGLTRGGVPLAPIARGAFIVEGVTLP